MVKQVVLVMLNLFHWKDDFKKWAWSSLLKGEWKTMQKIPLSIFKIEKEKTKSSLVVYIDQLLGAARTRKLVKLLFSAVFNFFLFILNLFQWFHGWNQRQFWCTPSGSRPALRSRQNHIFVVHFQTFFVDFSCEITEKGWK